MYLMLYQKMANTYKEAAATVLEEKEVEYEKIKKYL